MATPIGIFGGTFNPIHYGHLRSALELRERLGLAQVRIMPSAHPPHREAPECSAHARAEMISLAIAGEPGLVCDCRELEREGPSYTIDSLRELRTELGEEASICLIVGVDALAAIDTWHSWRALPTMAHIIVLARPGWELPSEGDVARWFRARLCDGSQAIHEQAAGAIVLQRMRPLEISSTEIRSLIAAGRSPRYLLPDAVWERIKTAGLYGYTSPNQE